MLFDKLLSLASVRRGIVEHGFSGDCTWDYSRHSAVFASPNRSPTTESAPRSDHVGKRVSGQLPPIGGRTQTVKPYLLTHNSLLSPEKTHRFLNETKAVQTWVSPYPCVSILLSDLTVNELTAVLNTHFGRIWFILVELETDRTNGRLPAEFWEYITNPQQAWSQNLFGNIATKKPSAPWVPMSGQKQESCR